MKGCLYVIAGFFGILIIIGIIGSMNSGNPGTPQTSETGNPGWRTKATSSVSRASKLVGGFATGQDTADYALGLQHVAHAHQKLGNYTIAQVEDEGRAIRQQQASDEAAQHQREADAVNARQAAEDSHYFHGDPECLILDKRTLDTEADDYVVYVKGVVKNTCDKDLRYAQVEINFLNASGSVENSGLANVNNLAAGASWSFKTIQEGSDGGSWRVEKLTGF